MELDDQLATFSQTCISNGVDIDSEIYSLEKTLTLLAARGPIADFSSYADEEYDPEEIELENELDMIAKHSLEYYKENGYL